LSVAVQLKFLCVDVLELASAGLFKVIEGTVASYVMFLILLAGMVYYFGFRGPRKRTPHFEHKVKIQSLKTKITIPKIELPKLKIPKIDMPKPSLPDLPKVDVKKFFNSKTMIFAAILLLMLLVPQQSTVNDTATFQSQKLPIADTWLDDNTFDEIKQQITGDVIKAKPQKFTGAAPQIPTINITRTVPKSIEASVAMLFFAALFVIALIGVLYYYGFRE